MRRVCWATRLRGCLWGYLHAEMVMRIGRLALLCLLVVLGTARLARAVEPASSELICPAPISTCDSAERPCPDGYRCACVPSCPTCRDCAAQVCVPELSKRCRTACDCLLGVAWANE